MQQISTFCHFLQGGINIFMFSDNQMLCFEMILPIFYLQLFYVEQKRRKGFILFGFFAVI